jgi:5'-nucleotidase
VLAALVVLGACSGDDDDNGTTGATTAPSTSAATTAAPAEPLVVMVTNDDGVAAEGIDMLVNALEDVDDVEVHVVAPATNQSGTGGSVTDGALTVIDATTISGHDAKSVQGFPADTVVWAIDQNGLAVKPDLVISGVNFGQNLGKLIPISGTVGAASAAGARGIPALAVSAGLGEPADYPSAVDAAIAWLTDNRDDLVAGRVVNLNIPTCTTGAVRNVVDVPAAGEGEDPLAPVDCMSSLGDPATDVEAFVNGFVARTELQRGQ